MITKYFIRFVCLLVMFTYYSKNTSSQLVAKLDDENMTNIENVMTNYITNQNVKGISVGIIYNGKVAYSKAKGLASTFPSNVAFNENHRSLLASISKTITGILAMKLVSNGHLGLNTTIDNYVPGYTGTAITIRHLLAHQSGIAHYDFCPSGYNGLFDAAASLQVVQGCAICVAPPGSAKLYTTFGTTLLGVIIDVVGRAIYNKGYIQLYDEWIRMPGGLTTLIPAHSNGNPDLAQPHSSNGNANTSSWSDCGWKLPAGGFISTAHDLAKYGAGVMNYSFLDSVTSNSMWVPQATSGSPVVVCSNTANAAIGLSFFINSSGDDLQISHNGSNDHGYTSDMLLYPRQKTGIVILVNQDISVGTLNSIRNDILNYVLAPSTRNFTSEINWAGNWVYEATSAITAQNRITSTSGSIVFDAASSVTLKPGFEAVAGTNFRALIDGYLGSVRPTNSQ